MPIVTVDGPVAVSGVVTTGTAAAGQVPVASSASAGAWAYPPGFEINYTQITSNANVTDTSEATATALISPAAITFDGTAVLVEFFCASVLTDTAAAGDQLIISLFEGSTQITRLAVLNSLVTSQHREPVVGRYRFTPTAAAHTYKVTAFTTSTTGTPTLAAGSGGTAGMPPAFIRFTKV